MERADGVLGTVPRLTSGLSDDAGMVSKRDGRRILKELKETHVQFPQVDVSVVTLNGIPDQVNLSTYTFWLFNRSEVAQQLEIEGRNHDVLITIDAASRKAAIIIGYGLEPLIGPRHLQRILDAGRPLLLAGNNAAGILIMLENLRSLLREIAAGTRRAFALPEERTDVKKSMTEAALEY